jgi:hypothetical protein
MLGINIIYIIRICVGHYVPQLSQIVYRKNKGVEKPIMNLKGFMVRRSCVHPTHIYLPLHCTAPQAISSIVSTTRSRALYYSPCINYIYK